MDSFALGVVIGATVGALLPIWGLSWLVSKGMKGVPAYPRIVYSGTVALAIALFITGFGNGDGSWNPGVSGIGHLLAAVIVIGLRTLFLRKQGDTQPE